MTKKGKKIIPKQTTDKKNTFVQTDYPLFETVPKTSHAISSKNRIEPQADWMDSSFEGQLSVDVFQTTDAIMIKSAIAGVRPEDIDISVTNDMVTIRGKRHEEEARRDADYLYRECFWGNFSRTIILPTEVETEKIEAAIKNGILTIILPKSKTSRNITIKVKGEDV